MSKLGFHLETETQLVSGLVQLGAINVAGESDGDAIPQLLLVTHTNLRGRMEFSGLAAEYCLCCLTWLLVSTLARMAASLSRANLHPMAKLEAPPMALLQVTPVSNWELFFK